MGANGLIGARAGQTVGHYVKLISLAADAEPLQALRHLARARDRDVRRRVCNGLPAGGAGEDRLEKYIADNLLPWAAADFAPEEAGVVDEDTYVQQGRDLERAYSLAGHQLHPGHAPAQHRPRDGRLPVHRRGLAPVHGARHARRTPTARRTRATTSPRSSTTSSAPDAARPVASRSARATSAARTRTPTRSSAITRELMGGDPTTFAGSDHGFAPQWYAVNANKVLNDATVDARHARDVSLHASNAQRLRTAAPPTTDLAKACWAGGTIQIYVNPTLPAGDRPTRQVRARRSGPRSRTSPTRRTRASR